MKARKKYIEQLLTLKETIKRDRSSNCKHLLTEIDRLLDDVQCSSDNSLISLAQSCQKWREAVERLLLMMDTSHKQPESDISYQ